MAIDLQGAARARPFVTAARATFPTVVDAENELGLLFGFKAIPNGVFVDEAGIVRYTKFGGFEIRKPEHRLLVESFLASADWTQLAAEAEVGTGFADAAVLAHFRAGMAAYTAGDSQAALAEWRQGVALEPENWIMRKQIWAIENPERFYAGAVDFAWQQEQIAQNR